MSLRDRDVLFRSTLAATVWIAVAMLAVLLIGLWGARRDLSDIREALFRAEIVRIHSHGLRTVARIEQEVQGDAAIDGQYMLRKSPWLAQLWEQNLPQEAQRLYAAVIDDNGLVVQHTDEQLIGARMKPDWPLPADTGINEPLGVTVQEHNILADGNSAIDIAIPIVVNEATIGSYHQGIDRRWFEHEVALQQKPVELRWAVIIGLMFSVVLLAAVSVYRISRRASALQHAISMSHVKQLSDLGRVVGVLAHEIRNPLNAIRLNLHALRNVLRGKASLSEGEIEQAIDESNREIQRLSELMKTMLGYARPDQAVVSEVNLNTEIEGMAGFLMPIMDRDGLKLEISLPDHPVVLSIDGDRFRQTLLNLLNNAREAAGRGGRVELLLIQNSDEVEIVVQDTGPGVPVSDRDQVFEAFYSTRDTGTGLGLALVKRFVEEAGGSVVCEGPTVADSDVGAIFRITLPFTEQPGLDAGEPSTEQHVASTATDQPTERSK